MKKNIGVDFLEDCVLINKELLVFGDVHIGYEEHIVEKGMLPDLQYKEIIERFDRIFENLRKNKIKIKQVIILGDLKHEFGGISDKEWRETLGLLDYLKKKIDKGVEEEDKIVLIKGNHDNILGPIAQKREIRVMDCYKKHRICFMHGNKIHKNCFEGCDFLFLGHLHPSITLSDNYKREKFKCFLYGKWKKKEIYVLPSFSPISFGFDLKSFSYDEEHNKGFFIVPEKNLKDFEVIIYNNKDKKEYNFGKLKKLL